MRLRRKQPTPLEQVRAAIKDEYSRVGQWEIRKQIEADFALAKMFAFMRGADLEKIREIVNDPNRSMTTKIVQIRNVLDEAW